MNHRQFFVRDLKQWLMPLSHADVPRVSAETYSPETLNALRSILVEIEEASVYVAITTSIAGALVEGHSDILAPQHLQSYTPPNPEVYRSAIDSVVGAGLGLSIILPIQAYHARLSNALRLTRAILEAGPAPSHTVRGSEYQKLEQAWRHVCGTALAAISTLRETLASVRFSRPPVNNENAEALLRSAKSGGRPCIATDGSVKMPRWAENRVHTRHVMHQPARLLMQGGVQDVLIENVSCTGLGLSGVIDGVTGTRISLDFDNGERLTGKLMWVRATRAGVHLDVMLMPKHPLLLAAQPN
ncbi:MAG: hypothetical protein ABL907_10855 [Hyphomicrobium sp.]